MINTLLYHYSTHKKRIVFYLCFILLGGVCVCLTSLIAGFAAYQHGMGPPGGAGISMSIRVDQSRYDEVKAFLLSEKEGKLISEDEYLEFKRNQPHAEMAGWH